MRYLGSKTLLLQDIGNLLTSYHPGAVFCDPFGGVGTVGSYMKQQGFQVISGDLLQFAHFFQIALIELNNLPAFSGITYEWNDTGGLEEYLNGLRADRGWLIEEYCNKRQFFTLDNALRIQACIDTIWGWNSEGKLSHEEYAFLIASLINSMDKVANTAGTYYAYLKTFYRKARQTFQFKLLQPVKGQNKCQCFLKDANTLIHDLPCDILYLDPPYNTRDYSKYYHLPETIAKGIAPIATGRSGVPQRQDVRSPYIIRSCVESSFSELIQQAQCKTIIFHYTDKGLLSNQFISQTLSEQGLVEEYYFGCKGYQTKGVAQDSQHHVYKVTKKVTK